MALQSVTSTPAEDLPSNEIERLLDAALGKRWLADCMGKLSPAQLKLARSLADDHVKNTILNIRALGKGLGNTEDHLMEKDDVRRIGWTITSLANFAEVCTTLVMMAEELSTPEGRAWQLEGKLSATRGGAP